MDINGTIMIHYVPLFSGSMGDVSTSFEVLGGYMDGHVFPRPSKKHTPSN
jgi:hypothetical protein